MGMVTRVSDSSVTRVQATSPSPGEGEGRFEWAVEEGEYGY